MKQLRIYIDTSVIGGCFDEEFFVESQAIFEAAENGKLQLVVSQVVLDELKPAPQSVRNFALENQELMEIVQVNESAIALMRAYLHAKIVTPKSRNDALHVAIATVARVDAIVSWNFKHIVKLQKIKEYHRVNFENGYGNLEIISPKEI